MEEEISQELINSITSKIKDDMIKQASFLLFSLTKKYSIEDSLNATKGFIEAKGWTLKDNDREFLNNISQKSLIGIGKWVDFNLKRAARHQE
jgi:hypothetical protein